MQQHVQSEERFTRVSKSASVRAKSPGRGTGYCTAAGNILEQSCLVREFLLLLQGCADLLSVNPVTTSPELPNPAVCTNPNPCKRMKHRILLLRRSLKADPTILALKSLDRSREALLGMSG